MHSDENLGVSIIVNYLPWAEYHSAPAQSLVPIPRSTQTETSRGGLIKGTNTCIETINCALTQTILRQINAIFLVLILRRDLDARFTGFVLKT